MRKRNTNPAACAFCKRRKIRCDKLQPCSSCIKYGNSECVYPTPGIDKGLKLHRDREAIQNEIALLQSKISHLEQDLASKSIDFTDLNFVNSFNDGFPFQELIGSNPIAQHDDKINFDHSKYKRRRSRKWNLMRNYTPFSWPSLMKHDNTGAAIIEYISYLSRLNHVDGVDVKLLKNGTLEDKFNRKELDLDGVSEWVKFNDPLIKMVTIAQQSTISQNASSSAIPVVSEESLVKSISSLLPSRTVINELLGVFFSRIYPMCPILDELDVRDDIERLLQFKGLEVSFRPESKLDFASMGILLTLMRLSYICLDLEQDTLAQETLNSDNIGHDLIATSKACLALFDFNTTTSSKVLQCAIMNRIYIKLSPEEGDCDRFTELATLNTTITSVAFSMGLHKNMENIYHSVKPSEANLSRKAWWVIYWIRLHHSIHQGSPLIWAPTDYETYRPQVSKEYLNISDLELEKVTVDLLNRDLDSRLAIEDTLRFILNVNSSVDMFEVAQRIGKLEASIIKHYGLAHEIIDLKSISDFEKVQACRLHLDVTSLVTAVLYSFIGYYENKKNSKLVAFYVKKLVVIICYDLIPLSDALFCIKEKKLKSIVRMFVIPDLINIIQKAALYFLTFYVRSKKDRLEETSYMFKGISKTLLDMMIDFSPQYFSAWRLSKTVAITYELVKEENLFEFAPVKAAPVFNFNQNQVEDLNGILKATMNRLHDLRQKMLSQGASIREVAWQDVLDAPLEQPVPLEQSSQNPEIDKIWEELLAKGDRGMEGFDGGLSIDDILVDNVLLDFLDQ